jgi:hypothetical protein
VEYTLIATPSIVVSPKELGDMFTALDEDVTEKIRWSDRHMSSNPFKRYTSEEVSGTFDERAGYTKFKLVRSHPVSELTGSTFEQRAALRTLQDRWPFLEDTTLLDDFVFLKTLLDNDQSFSDHGDGIEFTHRLYMTEPKKYLGDKINQHTLCLEATVHSNSKEDGIRIYLRPGTSASYARFAIS